MNHHTPRNPSRLASLDTATRILASFVVAVVLLLAVGGVAWWSTGELTASVENLADRKLPSVEALADMDEAKTAVARAINALLLRRADATLRRDSRANVDNGLKRLEQDAVRYEAMPHGADTLRLWANATSAVASWRSRVTAALSILDERSRLLEAGKDPGSAELLALDERAWAAYGEVRAAFAPLDDAIGKVVDKTHDDAKQAALEGHAAAGTAKVALVVSILLGAALLVLLGVLLGRAIGKNVRTVIAEAGKLQQAVAAGTLEVRADLDGVTPEFQPVLQGMNDTMDAFARPIAVTVDYATRISTGDIPPRITERYAGDFDKIKTALNRCIDAVNALVTDAGTLARAGVDGKLSTRADASKHQGDFRKIVQGVNDTLDAVVAPLEVAAKCVDDISKGAIPPKITAEYKGDFDLIKRNLNGCIDAVNALVADANALSRAAVAGKLATRADASKHEGDFKKIVQGVNDTLDAVIGPLGVAAKYVDDISKGAIPAKITAEYKGDFNQLKDNLNTCIDAVNALVTDANKLADAAVAGKLDTRADASRHQGDFRKIVDGFNKTLDAVLAPIQEAAGVLEQLSRRDLRARVQGSYQGDHAKIKESVNATGEALHGAIAQVAEAVEQVSSAAAQIASSSQAVASGASEQASSLEETSSSVDSVSGMTKQSADNAQQANQLAGTARTAATEGAASMEQMQSAMGKIKASAEGTSQIIKDINDIAFQTNLLALNAAVEAARAGEAGRGFAVVAEEVRSLALRAKEAATKTEELIRQSVKEANEGEATARHVAGKLGEIVSGVGKVTDIVSEIAAAAKEQSAGIDQVNKAIAEMDKVTQQNAASAEESSSAASELSGQSEELAAMVGAFQLDRGAKKTGALRRPHQAPAPAAARRAAPSKAPVAALAPKNGHASAFPMDDDTAVRDF